MNKLKRIFLQTALSAHDIAIFFRQFATLISAHVPLIQCCDMLEKSQEHQATRHLIRAIRRDILLGKSLFHCFAKHPAYFNDFICHLIRVGERTGKLDHMLTLIAAHLEKNLAFKSRIKQALFYPCLVILVSIAMLITLFLFLVPRFAELYQAAHVPLPALTAVIFYLSEHLVYFLALLFLIAAMAAVTLYHGKQSLTLKHALQTLSEKLPIYRTFRQKMLLTRFSKHLSITLSAGIPIIDALNLTASVCGDARFIHTLKQIEHQLSAGKQLHHAMASHPFFPPLMVQMIKIGETTGAICTMLDHVNALFEADLDQLLNRLHLLVEPLIMIVLGALIGGIVIGMYLPVFNLGSTL